MLLVTALFACAVLAYSAGPASAVEYMSAPTAMGQSKAGKVILIDVRSRGEWHRDGIPKGAKAISIHNPKGMDAFTTRVLAAVGGDRSRPIALICARGVRSARAQRYLKAQGFTRVYNVVEGMQGHGLLAGRKMRGWLARGLPTEPCPVC